MYTRTCKHCGREFQSKARNTWYCDECKTWKCPTCGKEVVLSGSKLTKAFELGYHYCSRKCAHAARLEDPEYHEKLSEMGRKARANDSEETKALRSRRIREALADPEVHERRKATNLERHGYETSFQNPDILRRAVELGHTPEAMEKQRATLRERYGVENPFQIPGVNERAVANSTTPDALERRSQSLRRTLSERGDEIDAKRRATNLERHGVEYPVNTPESHASSAASSRERGRSTREAIIKCRIEHPEWSRQQIADATGLDYRTVSESERHYHYGIPPSPRSSYEERFADALEQAGVGFEREFVIDRKRFDFKVGNVLVEIDPWHSHNSTRNTFGGEPKSRDYHLSKSRLAWDSGYRCIHVFDWDDADKVVGLLSPVTMVGARDCRVVDGLSLSSFFDSFHLQGKVRGVVETAALTSADGTILSAMAFGRPRYRSDVEWELLRYCVRFGWGVRGGAEKLFSHWRESHPGSVVSYCDRSKFDGGVYERLGFRLDGENHPSCHWYEPKTGRHITDALLRSKGADALIGTHDGKGTSNAAIMEREGWVAIYDCGQARYVYE